MFRVNLVVIPTLFVEEDFESLTPVLVQFSVQRALLRVLSYCSYVPADCLTTFCTPFVYYIYNKVLQFVDGRGFCLTVFAPTVLERSADVVQRSECGLSY